MTKKEIILDGIKGFLGGMAIIAFYFAIAAYMY